MAAASHIDQSIYITDFAFTWYDFNPDDIAGVMIHEATHAWQESVALDQVGPEVMTPKWFVPHHAGIERQALDVMERENIRGRLELSLRAKDDIEEYRAKFPLGIDSPFILPNGVP